MALKKESRRYIVDDNGIVTEDRTRSERISSFFSNLFKAIATIVKAVSDSVKHDWEKLGKVPKLQSIEQFRNERFKASRDNIAYMMVFIGLAIGMWKAEILPTLWMATGVVEALGGIAEAMAVRESIRTNDWELYKKSAKISAVLLRSWIVTVILATVLSWAVADGRLDSIVLYFPSVRDFSTWMIQKVNEALEVFYRLSGK